METRAFKPAVMSVGKVHREIDMSAQGLETGVVEPPDRTHVAGYRPDRQVLVAASDGLSNYPFDKKSPNASAAETISDDDRFDLATGAAIKQARKTDNPAIEVGHPRCHSFWYSEIAVERAPGILASDRRVLVYPSMMLSQFHPQHPAGHADAWELLRQRLGQGRLAAEPHAVEEIMNRSARLPLALAVVAARAATYPRFPLSALADELRQARGSLDAFTGEVLATDVRAVFSWSYDMLGAESVRLFRLLGLHPGPDTTVPAAASLAGLSAGQVLPLLAELARAHLLIQHAPGRYGFHDLLRAYAIELTQVQDTRGERDAALHRVFDHYLHTAHRAEAVLYPFRHAISLGEPQPGVTPEGFGDHAQAMAWFTAEHQVLLAAIRCAASCRFDTHAWQIAWALATFLHRPAHDHLRQAIDRFTETGDRVGQAYAHLNVGIVHEYQGQFQQALESSLQALALFIAAEHQPGRAAALNSVGWMHAMLGDYNQALTYSAQGLVQYEEIGNRSGMAFALDSLGYSHYHLGHHHQAVSLYRRAIGLSRESGDRYYEAMSLRYLGDAHHAAGDHDSARQAWRESLAILDQLGHPDAGQVRMQLTASANGSDLP